MRSIKVVLSLLVVVLSLLISDIAFAKDPLVFDSRKTLAMSENEPVYKDYYINAGTEVGLRSGVVITVKRRMSLYDTYQNKSPGDLTVAVGKLKVIHAQKGLAVAREHTKFSRKNRPVVEYDYVMVGDFIDLSSAEMDRGKKKRNTASVSNTSGLLRKMLGPSLPEAASREFASESSEANKPNVKFNQQL